MDRCTVAVATDDLSIEEGAVLSGSFGVLLVVSGKKITKMNFYTSTIGAALIQERRLFQLRVKH